MLLLDLDLSSNRSNRSSRSFKYVITILSILIGLSCLAGFIVVGIKGNINRKLANDCEGDTQPVLCFIRLIIVNALETHWDRYVMVTLLLTYASIFFHIIVESNRTNISGLLGQMIIQTICIIIGLGICFPILFLPSYIHFYKSKTHSNKSPVPIDILCIGFIYIICIIVVPTYLLYFLPSHHLITTISSVVLLVSPLGFALISLPFRLLSGVIQRCWIINSHRLIVHCQVALFILFTPLFFITLVSLIMHGSFDVIKRSYVNEITHEIKPLTFIWSIDYLSLFLSLILFISTNEYLFRDSPYRMQSSKSKQIIGYLIFAVIFIITPCLAFPLYIAWEEYHYLQLT